LLHGLLIANYKLLANDLSGIHSDHEFFVGGDDQQLYLAVGSADDQVFATLAVLLSINGAAQIAKVFADSSSGGSTVFANTGGEDDSVNAVHGSGVAANGLSYPVVENVQSQSGTVVAVGSSVVEVTEVGGNAGDTQNAGLLVEDVQHLVDVEAILVHDELNSTGVQLTAAGAHGETYQGSEAHGGIDGLAAFDSADGAAVAHMAGDELQLFDGLAKHFSCTAGNIAVAGAMEAVTTDLVVVVVFVGDSIGVSLSGHGLMERGVENSNLGNVLAHNLGAGVDAGEVCGVVQRSKGDAVFDSLHNFVGDENGRSKGFTAVNNTVTDSVDFLHGSDNAVSFGSHLIEDSSDSFVMGGQIDVFIENGLAVQGSVLQMAADADTFAKTLCKNFFGSGIDELILQGRGTGVDNQNFHVDTSPMNK